VRVDRGGHTVAAVDVIHPADFRAEPDEAPRAVLTPVVALAALAAAVLGVAALAGLHGDTLLVAPISLALLGVVLTARRWDESRRLRAEADRWLERGYESRASRYAWRIDELTSVRERRLLACSVRDIVPELAARRRPTGSLLDRHALRPHRATLIALADRLDDLGRPVSAAGILGVHHLLTEPGSVLYAGSPLDERPRDVGAELGAVLDRLEVRP